MLDLLSFSVPARARQSSVVRLLFIVGSFQTLLHWTTILHSKKTFEKPYSNILKVLFAFFLYSFVFALKPFFLLFRMPTLFVSGASFLLLAPFIPLYQFATYSLQPYKGKINRIVVYFILLYLPRISPTQSTTAARKMQMLSDPQNLVF